MGFVSIHLGSWRDFTWEVGENHIRAFHFSGITSTPFKREKTEENSEISLHKIKPLLLSCKTATFIEQNSNFHRAKVAVLQLKRGTFSNALSCKQLQRQFLGKWVVNYFYILHTTFWWGIRPSGSLISKTCAPYWGEFQSWNCPTPPVWQSWQPPNDRTRPRQASRSNPSR